MPPWCKLAYIMKVGCRSKERKEGNICVPKKGCYIKISDNIVIEQKELNISSIKHFK